RGQADAGAERAREALAAAERESHAARGEAARIGGELAAANQFLRNHPGNRSAAHAEDASGPRPLSSELQVAPGYELALAAALGGRLDASLVEDVPDAEALLDRAGPEGGSALLAGQAGGPAAQAAA